MSSPDSVIVPIQKDNNVINEKSLLDRDFQFPSEAILEKNILQKTYKIKNPHHYGVTTLGGNLSDPEFPNDFPLVGSNSEPSNTFCNSYSKGKSKTVGCLETHLHQAEFLPETIIHKKSLDGRCLPGQAVVKPVAYHCSDPLCPTCARHWAGLETARSIKRFSEFFNLNVNSFNQLYLSRGKGKYKRNPVVFSIPREDYDLSFSSLYELKHITISMSEEDWKLPFSELKKKAETVLMMVGVEGGCILYHSKRWSRKYKIWRKGSHFHALGYLLNGRYDGKIVSEINAFSGIVLKVLPGDRSQIEEQIKTLMYQLSHAGVPSGQQHVVSWFGCCSYNQLSVPKKNKNYREEPKETCPLCKSPLRPVAYNNRTFLKDKKTKTYILDEKTKEKIPIWNNHPILNSKYDGKICIVPLDNWEYITRDGQKYDPITRTWSELFNNKYLDHAGYEEKSDEY